MKSTQVLPSDLLRGINLNVHVLIEYSIWRDLLTGCLCLKLMEMMLGEAMTDNRLAEVLLQQEEEVMLLRPPEIAIYFE